MPLFEFLLFLILILLLILHLVYNHLNLLNIVLIHCLNHHHLQWHLQAVNQLYLHLNYIHHLLHFDIFVVHNLQFLHQIYLILLHLQMIHLQIFDTNYHWFLILRFENNKLLRYIKNKPVNIRVGHIYQYNNNYYVKSVPI